ncbi:Protein of unknown function [Sulfitobacter brevis]|uniref:DUF3179 domain-containing protein n=1 Tax=Sulfitobacter brevis TaxID=74348 RepID=A0A1I2BCB6_9RHOB|nr:DUF3179 domain-containing protein [Sulfitobacter brevis]SFE53746.1 Protein of unknown function [Sulfitobacter brevis]
MQRLIQIMVALLLVNTPALAEPDIWKQEWPTTNFSKTSIKSWTEILSGGPPKDGIPAINTPKFQSDVKEGRLEANEPVLTVAIAGQRERAYPIRYLIWHEIVNDTIDGAPIAVTFCPLCNSGVTFDRQTDHGVLTFGVSGKLRNSDMVMFDRETQSWWQQATGEAIVGNLTGTELKMLPSWMESWSQFRERNSGTGLVMKQPATSRAYGRNPYQGYDTSARPFLYNGEMPPHGISPVARVVRVGNKAWPVSRVRDEGGVDEAGIKISWEAGQASALDTDIIAKGRDVGTIRVRDDQGRDVAHDVMFAFAFHAFWPEGSWMIGR